MSHPSEGRFPARAGSSDRARARTTDRFARILDDALRPDVARDGSAGRVAADRRRDSEALRIDVAPEVLRRLGFRPCSPSDRRRLRATRALRRAAVLAVLAVASVVGVTLHNAGSTVAQPPTVTIPVGIERGLIHQGERVESILGEVRSLLRARPEPGSDGRDPSEDAGEANGAPTDPEDGDSLPIRRAIAPGRWT